MVKPTFVPNPNIGEGIATPAEAGYRNALIYNLKEIYEPIMNTVHDGTPSLAKIDKISKYIDNFVRKNQRETDLQPHQFFYKAVLKANVKLHKLEPQLPEIHPDYTKLKPIQLQQHVNAQSIGDFLKAQVSQALLIHDIQTQAAATKKKPTPEEDMDDNIDSGFQKSQDRLDLMGLSGFVESNKAGMLSVYAAGGILLGEVIYVEWVSAGDDQVCDDCDELEAGSPYAVNDYPATPHPGCRCEPGDITIGKPDMSESFTLHLIY